jgi:hypothetical protein
MKNSETLTRLVEIIENVLTDNKWPRKLIETEEARKAALAEAEALRRTKDRIKMIHRELEYLSGHQGRDMAKAGMNAVDGEKSRRALLNLWQLDEAALEQLCVAAEQKELEAMRARSAKLFNELQELEKKLPKPPSPPTGE